MTWTTPTTAPWLAGHEPTSAELVTQVTNNLKALGDPWTAYTPAWTANTTNPTIGNGTITGTYRAAGKCITFRLVIVAGTTTGWGAGAYRFSYPVAPLDSTTNSNPGITGFFWDNSASQPFGAFGVGQTSAYFYVAASSNNSFWSPTVPVAGAVSDRICLSGTYEAA
jgi:hypothetical protein